MPRARLPQLHSVTDGSFEPNRKNPITLRDDEPLDENLKVIKIGGENTPLSLSKDEFRIKSDLFIEGKNISLTKKSLTISDSDNSESIVLNNQGL